MTFEEYRQSLLTKTRPAWTVTGEKSIPYGYQYELMDCGGGKANLNCYNGKKGFKFVTGGKLASALNQLLEGGAANLFGAASPAETGPVTSGNPFGLALPRIGADESGKGDFFGPLVVASFYLDEAAEKSLSGSGITDSKKLTDPQILRLAGKLDKLGNGHTVSLMPPEYNVEYAKTRNLNVLLSRLHGRCISELMARIGAPTDIIVDQFSPKTFELKRAINAPVGTTLHTRTKGEADLSVAAASILARAAFLDGMKALENDFACDIPAGAGSPVIKAGRVFKRNFGVNELTKVAKTHFKTMDSL